jgi:hypothetical protein
MNNDCIQINPIEELLSGIEVVHGTNYADALRWLIRRWKNRVTESLINVGGDGI